MVLALDIRTTLLYCLGCAYSKYLRFASLTVDIAADEGVMSTESNCNLV